MINTNNSSKSKTQKDDTIHIGLVLAGAVTAGAYTAGVIDYLMDTLQLWHQKYEEDPLNVPKPNVVIDVLTGASAGSIAAAVTLLGLATNKLNRVENPTSAEPNDSVSQNNLLFDTWVNLGVDKNESLAKQLLDGSDLLDKNEKVRSFFNTQFIDNLLEKVTHSVLSSKIETSLPLYINPNLEVLMTLSNLRGIPVDLYFNMNDTNASHTMSYHKAYAYFQYNKPQNGTPDKLPLNLNFTNGKEFCPEMEKCKEQLHLFLQSARASGAFPIGLRSVPFNDVFKDYISSNIETLFGKETNIKPDIKGNYDFLAVDGGMTNNEPIAEALRILKLKAKGGYHKLILIDPFPNYIKDESESDYSVKDDSLIQLIPQLYATLRNQSLFKESDIIDLFKEQNDKHMIWPTRYGKDGKMKNNNIACGAIGGFSGFLSREFRVHDYALGQKNCQSFLRHYFNMPIHNGDKDHHPTAKTWSAELKEKLKVKGDDGKIRLPIIPDLTVTSRRQITYSSCPDKEFLRFYPNLRDKQPQFPTIDFNQTIKPLHGLLKKRVKKVVKNVFEEIKNKEGEADNNGLVKQYFKEDILDVISKKVGSVLMKLFGANALSNTITKAAMKQLIHDLCEYELLILKNQNCKQTKDK